MVLAFIHPHLHVSSLFPTPSLYFLTLKGKDVSFANLQGDINLDFTGLKNRGTLPPMLLHLQSHEWEEPGEAAQSLILLNRTQLASLSLSHFMHWRK